LSTACTNRLQLTDPRENTRFIGYAINDRLQNSHGTRAQKDYSMKPLKAMSTACVVLFALACVVLFALLLAASIYLGARGSIKMEQPGQGARSHSDLEQDEMALAADMRKLRRSLRHGVNQFQIA
jgi:hypothetical protein